MAFFRMSPSKNPLPLCSFRLCASARASEETPAAINFLSSVERDASPEAGSAMGDDCGFF